MAAPETDGRKRYELIARAVALTGRPADNLSVSASWADNRGWDAGIVADGEGISVFYGPGWATVASVEDAVRLLKGVFADEIVCVTALEKDVPVHQALARHDDPTASFTALDRPILRDMPAIDYVMVRSWTGKRDRE